MAGSYEGSSAALAKVSGPGTALLVVGGINIVIIGLNTLMALTGAGLGAAAGGGGEEAMVQMASGVGGLIGGLIGLGLQSVVIFGALKMKKLESFGLAMAASIIAMLCSPCCIAGFPIGI